MITIRPAQLSDLANIQELNHAVMSRNQEYDPAINPDFDLQEAGRVFFASAIQDQDGIFLLALDENRIVGYINGSPKKQINRDVATFELENLGVLPDFRRLKVATQLYERFVQEAKLRNFKRLYVNCYYQNSIALDFYQKLGFAPIDISLEKEL